MAEIEAVDLEAVTPVGEVVLPRIPSGRIAGKTRRDDEMGARAQQLDPSLVSDLDASARQERNLPPRSAVSERFAKLNAAHGGHSWS